MRLPPSVCAPFVVVAVAPPMQAPVTSSLHKHSRVVLSTKNTKSSPHPLSLFPSFPQHHHTRSSSHHTLVLPRAGNPAAVYSCTPFLISSLPTHFPHHHCTTPSHHAFDHLLHRRRRLHGEHGGHLERAERQRWYVYSQLTGMFCIDMLASCRYQHLYRG